MKAAVYHEYGPPEVLHIEDVSKPSPKSDEVLVRVHATTVVTPDWRTRKAEPSLIIRMMNGLFRPKRIKILGLQFAGTIEKVGKSVDTFREGDAVFGSVGFKGGAHAEFVCVLPRKIAKKPDNLTFEEAAAILYGGITALHFIRKAHVAAGQNVMIYGASGSVGTAAVQLAKHFGARVTGVCSTANVALVKSLGADKVVDYTKEKFWKERRVYDSVFDTVGKSGFWRSMRVLKRGGYFILAIARLSWLLFGVLTSLTGRIKTGIILVRGQPGDVEFLADLARSGKFKPVISRTYPLEQIAEAHRYAETGHKVGDVAVTIG